MRYPRFLQNGGRIGFIAPSFGCSSEPYDTRFTAALARFEELGYTCVTGPNCRLDEGVGKSNTAEKCGAEINDFFLNDRSDVILSCGGGETMCEDLDFVDFDAIKTAEPKWYMGYSDNTNLVFPLTTLCDTAAIYGPCAPSFGLTPQHEALGDALALLRGEKLTMNSYGGWQADEDLPEELPPLQPYIINRPFKLRAFEGARETDEDVSFSGRLIGGCIDCLKSLCGTRFDGAADFARRYAADGTVWFMEAFSFSPMDMRRTLWQFENAGWFENAKGFLFGRPMTYGQEFMGLTHYQAALDILGKYGVPIVMDLDIGHLPPMMPLISGSLAEVKIRGGGFKIQMNLK